MAKNEHLLPRVTYPAFLLRLNRVKGQRSVDLGGPDVLAGQFMMKMRKMHFPKDFFRLLTEIGRQLTLIYSEGTVISPTWRLWRTGC